MIEDALRDPTRPKYTWSAMRKTPRRWRSRGSSRLPLGSARCRLSAALGDASGHVGRTTSGVDQG